MRKSVKKNKFFKKGNLKNKIIKHQSDKIDSLKNEIEQLNLSAEAKDEIIDYVEKFRSDMDDILASLEKKRDEYDVLIGELAEMRKVMNEEVFKKKWWIIKLLIK